MRLYMIDSSELMRRMVKESLLKVDDTKLFAKHHAEIAA